MNDAERRQLFAHGAMGLAACFGAYMGLVDGPRKQLVDARAESHSLTDDVRSAESLRDRVPAMTTALDRSAHEEAQIRDMGRLARDERSLFAAMMSLASANHVRLDEMNPIRSTAKPGQAPSSGQPAPAAPSDITVGYSMVAIAAYDDIAAFAGAIRTELGYSQIRSIRMTPVQDEHVRLVRAVIETEHYSFDTSPPRPAVADAGAH